MMRDHIYNLDCDGDEAPTDPRNQRAKEKTSWKHQVKQELSWMYEDEDE